LVHALLTPAIDKAVATWSYDWNVALSRRFCSAAFTWTQGRDLWFARWAFIEASASFAKSEKQFQVEGEPSEDRRICVPLKFCAQQAHACMSRSQQWPLATTRFPANPRSDYIVGICRGPHMKDVPKSVQTSLQQWTNIVAVNVRNRMENFHCQHLTDDQMKELNPIIRNAIYEALHGLFLLRSGKNESQKIYGALRIAREDLETSQQNGSSAILTRCTHS
jgi:hypothetical protein